MLKKSVGIIFVCMLFSVVAGMTYAAAETDDTVLLSKNAEYSWQKSGFEKIDRNMMKTDHDCTVLTDGNIQTSVKSDYSDSAGTASVIFDLKGFFEVDNIDVYAYCGSSNAVDSYDIYAGFDGMHFNRVAVCYNDDKSEGGFEKLEYNFYPKIKAKYIKLVFKKNEQVKYMQIGEVEIFGKAAKRDKLLTGNPIDISLDGREKTDTDAVYSWVMEQPFVTGDDMIESDKSKYLTDSNYLTCAYTSEENAACLFDLGKTYQVTDIDVFSEIGDGIFTDGYEVRVSTDGKKYYSLGYFVNENSRKNYGICSTKAWASSNKVGRYVKIIAHNGAEKMGLSQVCIYGFEFSTDDGNYDTMQNVEPTVFVKNHFAMFLDWSNYNGEENGVSQYALYVEKKPFDNVEKLTPKAIYGSGSEELQKRFSVYYNLEPESTFYVAMTPIDKDGTEKKQVMCVKIKTPSALNNDTVGNIFCINDFPYGGGFNIDHGDYEEQFMEYRRRLLYEIEPLNKNRWWQSDSNSHSHFETYLKMGIAFHIKARLEQSLGKLYNEKYGMWTFASGNEPDLDNTTPAAYWNKVKNNRRDMDIVDKRNKIADPVINNVIDYRGLKFLKEFYEADQRNGQYTRTLFDALDYHSYCGSAYGSYKGLKIGAPEMIYQQLKTLRDTMAEYGDENKPIISSEGGWATTFGGTNVPTDYDLQRDYLSRAYLIMAGEGVYEFYWYSFMDSGLDETNFEHGLGLVDWFGIPKKSYYGYYRLAHLLKDCKVTGKIENINHPYYGYKYWDEAKNSCIESVWNAAGEVTTANITSYSKDEKTVDVISSDGSFKSIKLTDGRGSVAISGTPIFIVSRRGVEISSIDKSFELTGKKLDIKPEENASLSIVRKSSSNTSEGIVRIKGAEGISIVSDTQIKANQMEIPVILYADKNASAGEQEVSIEVISNNEIIASMELNVTVIPPVKVEIVPEPREEGSIREWDIAIYLENTAQTAHSGICTVNGKNANGTNDIELSDNTIVFENLQPGEKKRFAVQVLKHSSKPNSVIAVTLAEEGTLAQYEYLFSFAAALNDGKTPEIDGVMSDGEWDNCMPILFDSKNQIQQISDWRGEEDLSGTAYAKWDDDYLYMAYKIRDNVHFQNFSGQDIWKGDSVQLAIDGGRNNHSASGHSFQFGFALSDDDEVRKWCWIAPQEYQKGSCDYINAKMKKEGNETVYEFAIPWKELLNDNRTAEEHGYVGISTLINDNDGADRRGWMEFMSGVGNGQNPQKFGELVLIKK